MTQNNLGLALWTLGERQAAPARLEEAVAAFYAALQERTRDARPARLGDRLKTISVSRFAPSASARALQRGSRRELRPIAWRWRSSRASGFHSNGR